MKIKVIERQGLPHTLTQADGNTFRIYPNETRVIDEKLISKGFHAEEAMGNFLLVPVKNEEIKNSKGGKK